MNTPLIYESILVVFVIILLLYDNFKQQNNDCLFSSTNDSWFIKNDTVKHCKYPEKKVSTIGLAFSCNTVDEANNLMACDSDPNFQRCQTEKMWQQGDEIFICVGPNILPHRFSSSQLGIRIENGQVIPIEKCIGDTSKQNIKLFYNNSECIDGEFKQLLIPLIYANTLPLLN